MTAPRVLSPPPADSLRRLQAELERVRAERDHLRLRLHAMELQLGDDPGRADGHDTERSVGRTAEGSLPRLPAADTAPVDRGLGLAENAVMGIQIFDLQQVRFVFVNARHEALTGYSLADLQGMSVADLSQLAHPDDLDLMRQGIHDLGLACPPTTPGPPHPVTYRTRHRNGSWLWLQAYLSEHERDQSGRLISYMCAFIDITDLVEAKEAANHFGQMAAHDLRAPARRIRQYIEMVQDNLPPALRLPEVQTGLDGIDRQARRLRELAEGMHILTTLRRAGDRQEVALDKVVDEVVDGMLGTGPARTRSVDRSILPTVSAHPGLVRAIYAQLIENALHHSDPDSTIHITCVRLAREWVLGVETRGPTVPPEILEAVFQPFRRGTLDDSGTGLGLAICRRAVRCHGGRIWMESEGPLTHVRFTLRPGGERGEGP